MMVILHSQGCRLSLVARSGDALDEVATRFRQKWKVTVVKNHSGEKSLWWKVTVVKSHCGEKSLWWAADDLLLIIVHCSNISYCPSTSQQVGERVRIKSFASILLFFWSSSCRKAFWLFGGTRCKEAGAPQVVTLTLDLALEQVFCHCQMLSWNQIYHFFKSKMIGFQYQRCLFYLWDHNFYEI